MNNQKPQDIHQYKRWLAKERHCEISDTTETYYNSVTTTVRQALAGSGFWKGLVASLREYDDEYRVKTGYPLFMGSYELTLDVKTFDSFLLKTFRKNVLENKRWPEPPANGWVLPQDWFSKINDIIRTSLVVKYLDAVEFTVEKITSFCGQYGLQCPSFLEAREEGYYAAHLYPKREFEIPKVTWDTQKVDFSIEIQVTTQLQEAIRNLLHKYYDERRKHVPKEEELKWQWDYKSDEFAANYLGHILHYVEGMIMEIRERQKGEH